MSRGFRALMERMIDYAGMFPPASLPLDEAIRNYARYRNDANGWMLGRFIFPAAQLIDLALYGELFSDQPPFSFAMLGRGGDTDILFADNVQRDLLDIEAFRRCHGDNVTVDVYEVRIPGPSAIDAIPRQVDKIGPPSLTPYLELARHDVASIVDGVREIAEQDAGRVENNPPSRCCAAGLKLGCGGRDASAYPSVEVATAAITACRNQNVKLKFTAGLHHPVRRFDATLGTHTHGFLNLFVAGVLAAARDLKGDQVKEILRDDDQTNFMFDHDGLYWGDYRASVAEIESARENAVVSFGSCSFDEPLDGLRAMGLLRSFP